MTRRQITYLVMMMLLAVPCPLAAGKRGGTTTEQFHGIDVSHHQGNIDWGVVKGDSRVGFVYVRATNGTRTDKNYHHNIAAARRHHLLVGSYHFLNPNCPVLTQFNNFKARVKRSEQDLIPVVDIEDVPELGVRWKPQQARDYLAEFVSLVQKHYGVKPMIYTSNTFFTDYLGRAFADFPLFIARYGTTEPAPKNGARWTLWQFTRHGRVKGINHDVDLSRFNKGLGVACIRMPGAKAKSGGRKGKSASGKAGKKTTANKPKATQQANTKKGGKATKPKAAPAASKKSTKRKKNERSKK